MNLISKYFSIIIFLTMCQFGQSSAMSGFLDQILIIKAESFVDYVIAHASQVDDELILIKDFASKLKKDLGDSVVVSFDLPELSFGKNVDESDKKILKQRIQSIQRTSRAFLSADFKKDSVSSRVSFKKIIQIFNDNIESHLDLFNNPDKNILYVFFGVDSRDNIFDFWIFNLIQ